MLMSYLIKYMGSTEAFELWQLSLLFGKYSIWSTKPISECYVHPAISF